MRILLDRSSGTEYLEHRLETHLAQKPLPAPDRRLVQELVFGLVRWQTTLDWLIDRKLFKRSPAPPIRVLLRLGLYQMFWLDRVPDYAAVNETIEIAKRNGLSAQAGFLNAVLRSYGREAETTLRLLNELKTRQPSLGFSHPAWLCDRWERFWGPDQLIQLLAWNNKPPPTFARLNTLRANASRLAELWQTEGVQFTPRGWDWTGEGLVFQLESHPSLATLPSFQQGGFYVQDPSTLLAVRELDPQPGDTVLDLCAAPGGKTTFIAQLLRNQGRIVAQDHHPDRLKLIKENCARLGVACVETAHSHSHSRSALPTPQFDRILVDAPCSNTGVMRRRVELRWRLQATDLLRLQKAQATLLQQAALRLKPGGTLVYSTCSLEPEENRQVVQSFLDEHSHFRLENERQLLPFIDGVDGAYVARLGSAGASPAAFGALA